MNDKREIGTGSRVPISTPDLVTQDMKNSRSSSSFSVVIEYIYLL